VPAIEVVRARAKDRPVLWRLMQLYLHDFSQIDGLAVNERGEFDYRWFDRYWNEPDRVPLLARVDGEWAGFALVRLGRPNQIAEFFVMRKHRRSGLGRTSPPSASHDGRVAG
jgi:predicted acetyltransferase